MLQISGCQTPGHCLQFSIHDYRQLRELLLDQSFQFGDFVLSSGRRSNYYFDGKQVTLHAQGALLAAKAVMAKLGRFDIQAIGGPTLGADPMLGALSVIHALAGRSMDFFIVRKNPKPHGKRLLIEGRALSPGTSVAVIDDVLTTGGSIMTAVEAVRSAGCDVAVAIVLVDREEGGREALKDHGVEVEPIYRLSDFNI